MSHLSNPGVNRQNTNIQAHVTLMMTELVRVGRNPLDLGQHMKRVSEKSLMIA